MEELKSIWLPASRAEAVRLPTSRASRAFDPRAQS
jgi:hypothetical protein